MKLAQGILSFFYCFVAIDEGATTGSDWKAASIPEDRVVEGHGDAFGRGIRFLGAADGLLDGSRVVQFTGP